MPAASRLALTLSLTATLACHALITGPQPQLKTASSFLCRRSSLHRLAAAAAGDDGGSDGSGEAGMEQASDPLYASLRARLTEMERPDDDEPIPFFAEEEEQERQQRERQAVADLERKLAMEAAGTGERDSRAIAMFTAQSLTLLSVGAVLVSGISYGALGPRFVHERGDMNRVGIVAPAAKAARYVDPDALLREETPDGSLFGKTDDFLYNQLFDGQFYRSLEDEKVVLGAIPSGDA